MRQKLLLLMAVLTTTSAFAYTFSAKNEDGVTLYYNYQTDGTAAITYSTNPSPCYEGEIKIPETVDYDGKTLNVVRIASKTFQYCPVTSVTIPNSVTSIGDNAFNGCSNLKELFIPASVKSIGDNAFGSALQKLALPFTVSFSSEFKLPSGTLLIVYDPSDSVYEGGLLYNGDKTQLLYVPISQKGAFTIPNSVIYILNSAFEKCTGLTEVTLSNSVTYIGWCAFRGCTNLKEIVFGNSLFGIADYAFMGCSSLTNLSFPNSVTTIGKEVFSGCSMLTELFFPPSVTDIDEEAFSDSSLKKVAIPYAASGNFGNWSGVAVYDQSDYVIEDGLIYNGNKTQLFYVPISQEGAFTIPESITQIGQNALFNCSNITKLIALPTTAPSTGNYCFGNMNFDIPLDLPAGSVKSYFTTGYWANFSHAVCQDIECLVNYSGMNYVIDPTTKEAILQSVEDQSQKELSIPASVKLGETRYDVTAIGTYSCYGMESLKNVTLKSNIQIIGVAAFYGCTSLTSVSFPEKVTKIGNGAFESCKKLQSITLDEALITIDDFAFYGCSSLREVILPNNLTEVGDAAFYECTNLAKVTFPSGKISIGEFAFSYSGVQSVDFKTDALPHACFIGCEALTSANIECSKIGTKSFKWCSSLTDCTFTGVQNIEAEAFYDCSELTAFDFTGVKSIGYEAFYSTNLEEVVLPASVESVGDGSFSSCSNLTKMIIAESPKPFSNYGSIADRVRELYIGRDCNDLKNLMGFSNLNTLAIGNNVTEIPIGTFKDCKNLSYLTLGSGLTTIGASAFSGCTALTNVTIPSNVTTIGDKAFENTSLKGKLAIGCGISAIGDLAFYGKDKPQSISIAATKAPAMSDNTFSNYDMPLYVPATSIDTYDVTPWSRFYDFAKPRALKEITSVSIGGETDLKGLKPGDTIKLNATIEPADASLPYIFWRSTNPEAATVDTYGNVTFLGLAGKGECEIVAETMYANGPIATVSVTGTSNGIQLIVNDSVNQSVGINAPAGIYNLQGICLRRTASDDDVKALPAGIYIINGKKVVIR